MGDYNLMYNEDDANDENFEIPYIGHSAYIDTSELTKYLEDHKNEFTVLSLNIQSIIAKFNSLYALLVELAEKELYFSAICLQESWLAVNSDVSILDIPTYKMLHQGKSRCSYHGGLLTYVHCDFSDTVRKQFRRSLVWEGQLIDIKGESLTAPINIFNIYRSPKDNNNNTTIENFIGELTPVITDLGKDYNTALAVGDFNINPLQLNEREKYNDFLKLMCTNSFCPQNYITYQICK